MSTVSFAVPVMLPCFVDDVRVADVLACGYVDHCNYSYDGSTNKMEITPIKADERYIGALEFNAVGQSYTIGVRHLTRLVLEANAADAARRREVAA